MLEPGSQTLVVSKILRSPSAGTRLRCIPPEGLKKSREPLPDRIAAAGGPPFLPLSAACNIREGPMRLKTGHGRNNETSVAQFWLQDVRDPLNPPGHSDGRCGPPFSRCSTHLGHWLPGSHRLCPTVHPRTRRCCTKYYSTMCVHLGGYDDGRGPPWVLDPDLALALALAIPVRQHSLVPSQWEASNTGAATLLHVQHMATTYYTSQGHCLWTACTCPWYLRLTAAPIYCAEVAEDRCQRSSLKHSHLDQFVLPCMVGESREGSCVCWPESAADTPRTTRCPR